MQSCAISFISFVSTTEFNDSKTFFSLPAEAKTKFINFQNLLRKASTAQLKVYNEFKF